MKKSKIKKAVAVLLSFITLISALTCSLVYLPSFAADSDLPAAGEAYVSNFKIILGSDEDRDASGKITKADDSSEIDQRIYNTIGDGAEPFDSDDSIGNDSSQHNGICRSFDTITYDIASKFALNTDRVPFFNKCKVHYDLFVPKPVETFAFDRASIATSEGTDASSIVETTVTEENPYTIDGRTYTVGQIISFDKTHERTDGLPLVNGVTDFTIKLNVYGASNGETVRISGAARMVCSPEISCSATSSQVTITAKKCVNAVLTSQSATVDELKDTFNFNSSNTKTNGVDWPKINGISVPNDGLGEIIGRRGFYGVGLYVYNSDATKGMKGLEAPKGTIKITIEPSVFVEDRNHSSTYIVTDSETNPNYTDYMPKLWYAMGFGDYLPTKSPGVPNHLLPIQYYSRAINREARPNLPYNNKTYFDAFYTKDVSRVTDDASTSQNWCDNGGDWTAEQNADGTITLTVKNYSVNFDSFPTMNYKNRNQIKETSSMTGTPEDNVSKEFLGQITSNKGYFSTCEFGVIQPYSNCNQSTHVEAFPYDIGTEYPCLMDWSDANDCLLNRVRTNLTITDVSIDDEDTNYISNDYFSVDNTTVKASMLSTGGTIEERCNFTYFETKDIDESSRYDTLKSTLPSASNDLGSDIAVLGQKIRIFSSTTFATGNEPEHTPQLIGHLVKYNPRLLSYNKDVPFRTKDTISKTWSNGGAYVVTIPESLLTGKTIDEVDEYLRTVSVDDSSIGLKYYQENSVNLIPTDETIIGIFYLKYNVSTVDNPYTVFEQAADGSLIPRMNPITVPSDFSVICTSDIADIGQTASITENSYAITSQNTLSDNAQSLLNSFNEGAESGTTLNWSAIKQAAAEDSLSKYYEINPVGYEKTVYDNGTIKTPQVFPKRGDTVYIIGEISSITKELLQKSDNVGELSIKKVFSSVKSDTVDYRLNPATWVETDSGTLATTITIIDTLPKHLSYVPGSSYQSAYKNDDGKYDAYVQPDLYTKEGTLIDEAYLKGHPDTHVNGGQQGTIIDGDTFEPIVIKKANGETELKWVFNVFAGEEIPPIYYSAKVDEDANIDGSSSNLLNTVTINSSNDIRIPTTENQKKSEAVIQINDANFAGYAKIAEKSNVVFDNFKYKKESDNDIKYRLLYSYSGTNISGFYFLDILPYNGDKGKSDFTGYYNLSSISVEGINKSVCDSSLSFYILPKNSFDKTKTYKTFNISDGWQQVSTKSTDNGVELVLPNNRTNEDIAAWCVTGTLKSTFKSYVSLTPYPTDITATNKYSNYGMTAETEFTPSTTLTGATLAGLAWYDVNKDGIRDEDETIWSGVKVTLMKLKEGGDANNINDYEVVKTSVPDMKTWPKEKQLAWLNGDTQTRRTLENEMGFVSTDVSVLTGNTIDVLTGNIIANDATDEAKNKYNFINIGEGKYAVKFEDGTKSISNFTTTLQNVGLNDKIDSDAYVKPGNPMTVFIPNITIEELKDKTRYHSDFHDAGFYESSTFEFTKISGHSKNEPLANAEFVLYRCSKDISNASIAAEILNKKVFNSDDWNMETNYMIQTSDENGLVKFTNLVNGIYLLVEQKAPEGYELSKGCWIIEVDSQKDELIKIHACENSGKPNAFIKGTEDDATVFYLPNYKKTVLPVSGSIGIGVFMTIGIVFMGASLIYVCKPIRKKYVKEH